MNKPDKTILEYALDYYDKHGLCVIPIPQRKKEPQIKWKEYQTERPNREQLQEWFRDEMINNRNIAVVLGEVSNGIACRDFDTNEGYKVWAKEYTNLANTLPTVKTARGYHVFYKGNVTGRKDITDVEGKHLGELRGSSHLCLLPPSLHPTGEEYRWINPLNNGNLLPLDPICAGFLRNNANVTERAERNERLERIEKKEEIEIDINKDKIIQAILRTLPRDYGTRHKMVFEFARELYSMPEYTDANPKQFKTVVKEWHKRALPNIRTKEFEETWIDFLKAWPKIRHKIGNEPITKVFKRASESEAPTIAIEKYPKNSNLQTLVSFCKELQIEAGSAPFFLATRTGGKLFNVKAMTMSRWLFLLEEDNIIKTVEKGGTSKNPRKATRFRYVAE
jgi:hypothetical protein